MDSAEANSNSTLLSYLTRKEDIIEWDTLCRMCSEVGVDVIKTDSIRGRRIRRFQNRGDKAVVIGGSDWEVTSPMAAAFQKIRLLVGQNVNFLDAKVECMPIGVPSLSHDRIIGDMSLICSTAEKDKIHKNLIYSCFKESTSPKFRNGIKKLFSAKKFVTTGDYERTSQGYARYVASIHSHKFVLCPRGNGIDTHRTWESLYLRSIPIQLSGSHFASYFSDLPILFVKNWSEALDEEFLNRQYDILSSKKFNMNKLKIQYWVNKLLEAKR